MVTRIRYNKEGETLVSRNPVLVGDQTLVVTIDTVTNTVVFSDANTDDQIATVQGETGQNLKILARQTLQEMGAVFTPEKRNRTKKFSEGDFSPLLQSKTGTEF